MSRIFATFTSGAHAQGSATTVTPCTLAPPATAVACFVQAVTNDAFVTFDGTTPSSSNGILLKQGTNPIFVPLGVGNSVIGLGSGGTATINVFWLL